MAQHGENVPAYRTVRVTQQDSPVARLADVDAWRARDAYPEIWFAGGPVFGVGREREEGGWQLHPYFSGTAPQDARDSMGSHFRKRAQEAERSGDRAAHGEWMRAAERMDWEAVDDMAVRGTRFRVIRADPFIRMGADGPEPPRPTDPDPSGSDPGREARDPTAGFVVDPVNGTGMSEGILKVELLRGGRKAGTVPADVHADSLRAVHTHPGGVLLPAAFMTAERVAGRWRPDSTVSAVTPQEARDGLAAQFRVWIPFHNELDEEERAAYEHAADLLEDDRADELAVLGRHFRIVRVERLVRIGPDGPESPRPSDPDPQPPVMVQNEQLRAQGLLVDEDDESQDPELEAQARELAHILQQEAARRAERQTRRRGRRRGGGRSG
ncbi:DUF5954 family protein [Streptomyces pathocidini]|uniref:DUF5954 family protein n=1 Tax=Streptomyces pathocidini TaxID=1650571 RepID=UPI0033F97AF4